VQHLPLLGPHATAESRLAHASMQLIRLLQQRRLQWVSGFNLPEDCGEISFCGERRGTIAN
jgi:hypothetical protein